MIYRIYFGGDRAGWAGRSYHYGESENITYLNKNLQWHKASKIPCANSPNAGWIGGKCLEFLTPDDVIDYLISLDFVKAMHRADKASKYGRKLHQIIVAQLENSSKSEDPSKEVCAIDLIRREVGEEVLSLIKLQLLDAKDKE